MLEGPSHPTERPGHLGGGDAAATDGDAASVTAGAGRFLPVEMPSNDPKAVPDGVLETAAIQTTVRTAPDPNESACGRVGGDDRLEEALHLVEIADQLRPGLDVAPTQPEPHDGGSVAAAAGDAAQGGYVNNDITI